MNDWGQKLSDGPDFGLLELFGVVEDVEVEKVDLETTFGHEIGGGNRVETTGE